MMAGQDRLAEAGHRSANGELRHAFGSLAVTFPATLEHGFRVWKRMDGWIQVLGEVDFFSAEAFREALSAAIPPTGACRIDLHGLGFIDSAGIRAMVQLAGTTKMELRLFSANPSLRKCWKILECEDLAPNVTFCEL